MNLNVESVLFAFQRIVYLEKKQKIRQFVYISAVRLIKRLAVATCQTVNSRQIIHCCETYTLWKHDHNHYLTIDRPKKEEKKDE